MLDRYAHNGLWFASLDGDYRGRIWLRDSFFVTLSYLIKGEREKVQAALDTIADLLDGGRPMPCWDASMRPVSVKNYLTGDPADRQNDVLGELMFLYARAKERGYRLGRRWDRAVRGLVDLLASERYWEQADSGMWEMDEAVRASSVGICVSGLREARTVGVKVPESLVARGEETLRGLLPRETETRFHDAALLFLVWPFRVVHNDMAGRIVRGILGTLVGRKGVARFVDDPYYEEDGITAQWSLFAPQLVLALRSLGMDVPPALRQLCREARDADYPESFVGPALLPNPNRPLAWSEAMHEIEEVLR